MPNLDRPISEFPRALEVLATALVLISNPSGIDSYDSYSCTLTELGKTILNVEYTQELGQVSVFEAIINLRVLSGTGDPSSSLGVDNQIYVKYQTVGGMDSVTAIYIKLNGTWVEIQTGGGATILYGTTDPSPSQGSDGQLYAKYANIVGSEVEITVYKPTDSQTVSITITENGNTVYTATPSCTIYGEYSEVSTTVTLSTGTYTLKHWGENVQIRDAESQFVEINGITVGFIHNGSNSSYTVDGSENVVVEYSGNTVIAMWLKIQSEWCPIKLDGEGGAIIDDNTPSQNTVYSSDKVEDLLSDKQDSLKQYDDTITTDSGGFFSVTMTDPYKVLSAWADQGDVIILPFPKTGAGNQDGNTVWWFKVTDQNLTARASTSLQIHFLYID